MKIFETHIYHSGTMFIISKNINFILITSCLLDIPNGIAIGKIQGSVRQIETLLYSKQNQIIDSNVCAATNLACSYFMQKNPNQHLFYKSCAHYDSNLKSIKIGYLWFQIQQRLFLCTSWLAIEVIDVDVSSQ